MAKHRDYVPLSERPIDQDLHERQIGLGRWLDKISVEYGDWFAKNAADELSTDELISVLVGLIFLHRTGDSLQSCGTMPARVSKGVLRSALRLSACEQNSLGALLRKALSDKESAKRGSVILAALVD